MRVSFLQEAAQASRPVVGQLRKLEEVASGGHRTRGCPAPSPACESLSLSCVLHAMAPGDTLVPDKSQAACFSLNLQGGIFFLKILCSWGTCSP